MKHLGDITKLDGAKIPKVDIICGGSPCQDLSVAGKREGLAGERSGLFMEQIRVIKEMRESDRANGRTNEHIRPRYMVWENVQGAFSSNKGEDFRCVLEETSKIADENAIIPRLETGKDGKQKWSKSGVIMGDGWSIAWRVHDAQFWGVPQRRKRISLIADFGGATAPEILFERESLSRDTTESREEGQGITTDAEAGTRETSESLSFQERAGKEGGCKGILIQKERTGALSTLNNQPICYGISSYDSNAMKSSNPHSGIYEAETTRTLDNNGGNPACNQGGMAVVQSVGVDTYNQSIDEEIAQPLRAADGGDSTPKVCYRKTSHAKSKEDGQGWEQTETNDTLNAFDNGESRTPTIVVEKEVTKRKYPVDKEKLIECLQNHRTLSIREISERLNKPKSLVEHWFRKDNCFAIPDADIWLELKKILNINNTEFDKSIMTFETKVGKYDMANRIHIGSISPTLTASSENDLHCVSIENHPNDSRVKIREDGTVQTLSSRMGTGGGNVPMVMEEPYNATTGSFMRAGNSGVAETLAARDYKDPQIVSYGVDCYNQSQSKEMAKSITSAATDANHIPCTYNNTSVVRRLTPLECERLQGFPDGWTDIGDWIDSKGKKHKGEADSPRYKALGNSIALPFWQWMAERMVKYIDHESTMGSLFDGIGGFPLVYSRVGCQPIWASEIEEFPIAVTKVRFPDDDEN